MPSSVELALGGNRRLGRRRCIDRAARGPASTRSPRLARSLSGVRRRQRGAAHGQHRVGRTFHVARVSRPAADIRRRRAIEREADMPSRRASRRRDRSTRERSASTWSAASIGSPEGAVHHRARRGDPWSSGRRRRRELADGVEGPGHSGGRRLVADTRDAWPAGWRPDLDDRHLVSGQRAGLVGADERDDPRRLDRLQALYQCVAGGHGPLLLRRQRQRDRRKKSFRYQRDRDTDREEETVRDGAARQHQRQAEEGGRRRAMAKTATTPTTRFSRTASGLGGRCVRRVSVAIAASLVPESVAVTSACAAP